MARSASGPRVRRGARGRGRGAGEPRAARSARQHAARPTASKAAAALAASRRRRRRAGRRSACASRSAPTPEIPRIHAEPAFIKGMIEVQDEGSQLAALLAGAKPGEQVIDLCAGAGGKTLALAAAMAEHGQIYATDHDKRRLAPIHERLARAGARNVQVRTPKVDRQRARRSRRPRRPRADRRALHRHRHLAAQPRRQVAGAARRARAAAARSRRRCSIARRRW